MKRAMAPDRTEDSGFDVAIRVTEDVARSHV